jgi:hypothetical protein
MTRSRIFPNPFERDDSPWGWPEDDDVDTQREFRERVHRDPHDEEEDDDESLSME